MELAVILARLRQERGLSQEQLSHASGVSVRTIRNLERGTTRPYPATLRALAQGLRLTEEERDLLDAAGGRRDSSPGYLPAPPNPLIGRHTEIEALVALVREDRTVTVVGPGGVGKSRLALEVAWRLANTFDRVDVVDLGPLRDRDEVRGAVAATTEPGTAATLPAIAAAIGRQRRLLVMDGVEHVPGIGPDLAALVTDCPHLHLLLTARTPPSPAGTVWVLEPLPLPDPAVLEPEIVRANPAVELFVERASASRPLFVVDESTVEHIVALCRRLDGLPLALELAGGLVGDRDIARVAAQLTVSSLRTDLVDVPPRHRSLTAAVEWSIALLDDSDRRVFLALGAFRGRVTVEALAAVLSAVAPIPGPLTEPLARLASASLLRIDDEAAVVDLLDTIREVAHDGLRAAGLADLCGHAHATFMLTVLKSGERSTVDRQFDDIRAAVEFACAAAQNLLDRAVVSSLADHLTARARFAEAHRLLSAIAASIDDADTAALAWLRAGVAANHHGDHRAALACGQAAQRRGGDLTIAARNLIGAAHKSLGELDQAREAYLACLAAAEASGEQRYVTVALNNLGTVAHERGDLELARTYYQRSLDIKTELGDARGIATALVNLGALEHDAGRPATGVGLLTQALERFRQLDEPHAVVFALALLSGAALAASDMAGATTWADEAIELAGGIDNGPVKAMACQAAGDLARARGELHDAASYYAEGLAYGPEPFERARLLDRLAAVTRADAPDRATALNAEAAQIRDRYGYVIPPADEPLVMRVAF